jgi:hypothetical protein
MLFSNIVGKDFSSRTLNELTAAAGGNSRKKIKIYKVEVFQADAASLLRLAHDVSRPFTRILDGTAAAISAGEYKAAKEASANDIYIMYTTASELNKRIQPASKKEVDVSPTEAMMVESRALVEYLRGIILQAEDVLVIPADTIAVIHHIQDERKTVAKIRRIFAQLNDAGEARTKKNLAVLHDLEKDIASQVRRAGELGIHIPDPPAEEAPAGAKATDGGGAHEDELRSLRAQLDRALKLAASSSTAGTPSDANNVALREELRSLKEKLRLAPSLPETTAASEELTRLQDRNRQLEVRRTL